MAYNMKKNFVRRASPGNTILGIAIGAFLTTGCGTSNKPMLPAGVQNPTQASDETGATIAHPEYANWSRFPEGVHVVRYRITTNENGKVEVTSTWKLEKKSEDFVEIVSQVNVQRSGEELQENPPESTKFPSQFKLPKGLSEEFFQLPSAKAKKTGEESLDVHGKSISTQIFEWTESNETGPMTVKLWRSDEVPGRIVRQEMLIESSQTKTIEELLEVNWNGI